MKLAIAVNHASPFFVGGSERVVEQISNSMNKEYGMECFVLCKYANKKIVHNGVTVLPTHQTEDSFLSQIKYINPDHLMVYSDSFNYWNCILKNSEKITAKKSICLVGMNFMRSRPNILREFKSKHNQFSVITHSNNYLDYHECNNSNIPVNVIHNAIDIKEFESNKVDFRHKYGINTSKIILCVSNFYPGKGQEHLMHSLKLLHSSFQDFTIVFICTDVNFQPAQSLRANLISNLKKMPFKSKVLINISREDTIGAFKSSDLFAFPSQIEVAPLVILEAMACGLPWVSLNVGNVSSLSGGLIVEGKNKSHGKFIYDNNMYNTFKQNMLSILTDNELSNKLKRSGINHVLSEFDWEKIKIQYKDIISA